MIDICEKPTRTENDVNVQQLLNFGKFLLDKYGLDILKYVDEYCKENSVLVGNELSEIYSKGFDDGSLELLRKCDTLSNHGMLPLKMYVIYNEREKIKKNKDSYED